MHDCIIKMIKIDLPARIMKWSVLICIDGIYVYLTSGDQIGNYVKMAVPGEEIMNRQVASDNNIKNLSHAYHCKIY